MRGKLLKTTALLGAVKRGLLLYVSGMKSHFCDLEAQERSDIHRAEFGCVEPPPDLIKRSNQSPMNRGLQRYAQPSGRMRSCNPHKVPACAPDAEIQLGDQGSVGFSPSFAKRHLVQTGSLRQDTPFAQKHRMQLHGCGLSGTAGSRSSLDSPAIATGATIPFEEECSRMKSSVNFTAFARTTAGSMPGSPVASGSFAGPPAC